MELSARYLGNTKFEATTRGHRVICDQPVENGGLDEGMTPPEFLLASLATCAGYYAAEYMKARSLPVENLNVRVRAEKAPRPARIAFFRIDVEVSGLTDRHQHGVLRAVEACLIHNTLLGAPQLEVAVNGLTSARPEPAAMPEPEANTPANFHPE